jgi:hypothetical protein
VSARRSRDGFATSGSGGVPGVEWWLLENGTVTQQASAGVSRDTSPSIPHGETPSGAAVHASRKELSGSDPGGSPISSSVGFRRG